MSTPEKLGWLILLAITMALTLLTGCADAPREIAEDPSTGFALYRTGN